MKKITVLSMAIALPLITQNHNTLKIMEVNKDVKTNH